MKKILLFLYVLLFGISSAFAQPPQYVFTGTGSNNVFPFSSTSSNRVQWVYNQNQFSPSLPMGTITKLYFKSLSTHSGATYTNLSISIGTTTITAMPSGGGVWAAGLTNCLSASSFSTGPVTNGGWVEFTLTSPYFYDGTSNFIVDVSQTAYTTGFTIQQSASTGSRRQWGNVLNTTISGSGTGQAELGIDIIPGSPCTKAIGTPATNINSVSAQLNWNAVPASFKYEYIIDTTNPGKALTGITATTATSAFVSGLIPNKQHYMRVRNYCSAISYSMWDTVAFMTLPPCNKTTGFVASNIDSNSANIQWDTAANIVSWQYLVDTLRSAPFLSNPGIKTTNTRFKSLTGLEEGRWHYVHIRSKCVANDSSAWSLDSFYTPAPCRKPVLSLTFVSHNNSIVNWPAVKTAVNYEYFFGAAADIPPNGTPLLIPAIQTPYLQPNTNYSVHVRCNCNDNGVKQKSGWASLDFTSNPPLAINTLPNEPFALSTYPNPVKDKLVIKANRIPDGAATVSITDMKGSVIERINIEKQETIVNTTRYTPGIYLLQYTDNATATSVKFTKE